MLHGEIRKTHSRQETLNARSEYTSNTADGRAEHHINQYTIKNEIGRGSFGAVHLATDQYGTEYVCRTSACMSYIKLMTVTGSQGIFQI